MVYNLEPACNFLFRYILCTVPKDTIDVDNTVHILKGIHFLRIDQSTQISRCSLWGTEVKLVLSLRKKMKDYIKECQDIVNPFTHRSYPSRPNPLTIQKWPKATPVKRSTMVTRCNIEKNYQNWENKHGIPSHIFPMKLVCPSQGSRILIPGSHI